MPSGATAPHIIVKGKHSDDLGCLDSTYIVQKCSNCKFPVCVVSNEFPCQDMWDNIQIPYPADWHFTPDGELCSMSSADAANHMQLRTYASSPLPVEGFAGTTVTELPVHVGAHCPACDKCIITIWLPCVPNAPEGEMHFVCPNAPPGNTCEETIATAQASGHWDMEFLFSSQARARVSSRYMSFRFDPPKAFPPLQVSI